MCVTLHPSTSSKDQVKQKAPGEATRSLTLGAQNQRCAPWRTDLPRRHRFLKRAPWPQLRLRCCHFGDGSLRSDHPILASACAQLMPALRALAPPVHNSLHEARWALRFLAPAFSVCQSLGNAFKVQRWEELEVKGPCGCFPGCCQGGLNPSVCWQCWQCWQSVYSLLPQLGMAALTPQPSSSQGLWVCTDQVSASRPSRRAGEGASHLL